MFDRGTELVPLNENLAIKMVEEVRKKIKEFANSEIDPKVIDQVGVERNKQLVDLVDSFLVEIWSLELDEAEVEAMGVDEKINQLEKEANKEGYSFLVQLGDRLRERRIMETDNYRMVVHAEDGNSEVGLRAKTYNVAKSTRGDGSKMMNVRFFPSLELSKNDSLKSLLGILANYQDAYNHEGDTAQLGEIKRQFIDKAVDLLLPYFKVIATSKTKQIGSREVTPIIFAQQPVLGDIPDELAGENGKETLEGYIISKVLHVLEPAWTSEVIKGLNDRLFSDEKILVAGIKIKDPYI